ncbi:hypothetical protein KR018_010831, partial [Drosophila ironensis]
NESFSFEGFCLCCVCQKPRTSDHAKLKQLHLEVLTAISEATAGTKYGSAWVPDLGKVLVAIHHHHVSGCINFSELLEAIKNSCPKPAQYYPETPAKPTAKPTPHPWAFPYSFPWWLNPPTTTATTAATTAEPPPPRDPEEALNIEYDLTYPDNSYFPWCYPPDCPPICHEPYCYHCVEPHCDPECKPPHCYPPCKLPHCQRAPTCWPPYCPVPCKLPCVAGIVDKTKGSCVPPFCPLPGTCTRPFCPKLSRAKQKGRYRSGGACPMRDIVYKIENM